MNGERLSELRKREKMTQKDLANALHVSLNSISLYERNGSTPDDETKVKIAEMFNVSLDYLMGLTPYERPLHGETSEIFYYGNLPEKASQELRAFVEQLKKKYGF